ncbi:tetratricopeptide repeat protein [Actinomadura kijaniata]|uniref:tetratricopeptide repeat protein n=1 Tax=Actinomadura kijaniata TaxID=46161 RepID=UPI003F195154
MSSQQVYIVHAQPDLEWALPMATRLRADERLRARGLEVVLEEWALLPGDSIVGRVETMIRRAAFSVFVFSRASTDDRWMDEKYWALVGRAEHRFVPVLLDDVALPPFAASRVVADFRGEEQDVPYERLVRALCGDRSAPAGGTPLAAYRTHLLEGPRELVVEIGPNRVVLETLDGGEPLAEHSPNGLPGGFDHALWELERARRGAPHLLTKSGEPHRGRGVLLQTRLHEVGEALGRAYLSGAAGGALAAAVNEAAAQNRALRLGLRVDNGLAYLPWETLALPGQSASLALHPNVELYRHLPASAAPVAVPIKAPLRILAVVASPDDPDGGPLLNMEDELRRILDAVDEARRHAAAHVRVLNEGTLDSVRTALRQERFHVLHISCHAEPGVLVMEDENGDRDDVSAARLAEALPRDEGVPLIVLSGCSTALDVPAEEEQALTGLAGGLSAAGVPAVLAMTAPVTDLYAALLGEAFYRELALRPRPEPLTALAEARRELEKRRQAAPEGSRDADLAEWATPALFLRGPSLPLYDVNDGVDTDIKPPPAVTLDPGVVVRPVGDFVGRRAELRSLLSTLRRGGRGVLLHGIGGVGKSTLAAELIGRLGDDAGLVVSLTGQKHPEQVLEAISGQLFAATAVMGSAGEPLRQVALFVRTVEYPRPVRLDALAGLPAPFAITLLLDNFEDNLNRSEDPARVDEDLAEFLSSWIRLPGRSRLIITSRYPFALPDDAHEDLHVHHLGPLSLAEARKLIWRLPALNALEPAEQERAWAEVGGHPRTLEYLDALLRGGEARFGDITRRLTRLIKQRSDVDDPKALLEQTTGDFDVALVESVTLAARDVLLGDLVGLLSEFERRVLVGVSVYRRPVDRTGAVWPVSDPIDPDPDLETRLERWGGLLSQAGRSNPEMGLENLGLSPQELTQAYADLQAWRTAPVRVPERVDATLGRLARLGLVTATPVRERNGGGDTDGGGVWWGVHRWTAAALARPDWTREQELTGAHLAASQYWTWRVRMRPQDPQQDVADAVEARFHAHAAGDLETAFVATGTVCDRLHTWGAWDWEQQLLTQTLDWFPHSNRYRATLLRQLGMIARGRGEYEQALKWYQSSLLIFEESDDRPGMAYNYHQFGILAQEQGEYEQALKWYQRSLILKEELGDRPGIAASYHQLGILAQEQGQYEQALKWYQRSLPIFEESDNRPGMAHSYHQLGILAQGQGQYEQALKWYQRSLILKEELGDRSGVARSHGNLGMIAQEQGEYEQALEWYQRSLTIFEELDNRPGMAKGYGQIGSLFTQTGQFEKAVGYSVRSLVLSLQLHAPQAAAVLYWLGRQRQELSDDVFRALVAEHLHADDVDALIAMLDSLDE